tara:strand:+ start:981 stop:1376 length:396 start_codon:yes stop_codon:yes gene_type:complete
MNFLRYFKTFGLAVMLLAGVVIVNWASADTPTSVTKILPPQLDLFDLDTQEPAGALLRIELEGKKISILDSIADGAAYEIQIDGGKKFLIRSEDVETNLDAEFQKKCRTQVSSVAAGSGGTGRGFGAGCTK